MTQPDLRRESKAFLEWNPGRSLLASIRAWQCAKQQGGLLGELWAKVHVLRHRLWSAISGADIPVNSRIGAGLLLPHPNGIVIHPDAAIGVNCLIFQQVTLGANQHGHIPTVGNCVDIGAGAKIIGNVKIGDHALIGANAVVVSDVPAWHVAVGIPATCRVRKDAPEGIIQAGG